MWSACYGYGTATPTATVGYMTFTPTPTSTPSRTATPSATTWYVTSTPTRTSSPTATRTATPGGSTGIVYITNTGTKYHRDGCRYLASSKIAKTCSWVISHGYTACSVCKPVCGSASGTLQSCHAQTSGEHTHDLESNCSCTCPDDDELYDAQVRLVDRPAY